MITEDQLEQLCLDWFKSIGYDTICGYDIAPDGNSPERNDYRQIILFDRLLSQLQIINPQLPASVLANVASNVKFLFRDVSVRFKVVNVDKATEKHYERGRLG